MPSVLLVDDEPTLRRVISRSLSRVGFEVTCAENGHVAWQLVKERPYDVILSDVRMPVMSGPELLAKVCGEMPGIPVILISGSGEIRNKQQAVENGAFDFLSKPVRLLDVELAVRAAAASVAHSYRDGGQRLAAPSAE
jgi:DNA-binding NtrC family response regulator